MALPQPLLFLLKEDGEGGPHQGLQIGLLHLPGHCLGGLGPLLLDGVGNLPGHGGGRGAGAAGVGEDVHGGEGTAADEVQGLGELLLRLLGEAHNEVGGDGGAVKILVEPLHRLEITGGVVLAVHPLQGLVTPGLHGQVEVGAQVGQRHRPLAEVLGDGAGLQRAQTHPQPRHGVAQGLHQVDEGLALLQIPAPGGNLDAGEHDLPVPLGLQLLGLVHRLGKGEGAHRASGVGDDAVGAEVGAPVLHLEHGPGAAHLAPGGEPLKVPAAQGLVHLDDGGGVVLKLPLQQVQKLHAPGGAGHQVHPQGGHRLRLGLGVAAAHRHHRLGVHLFGSADDVAALLVTDGGDGTGVDDVGVGQVLKGDQGVTAAEQLALHGLGLILVDLAAQGVDGNVHRGLLKAAFFLMIPFP